jgi:hypothetical protein
MPPDQRSDAPEIDRLLKRLDHPTPTVTAADVRARARASRRSPWRRVAVVTLLLAAGGTGVAYAASSPAVRAWLAEARDRVVSSVAARVGSPPPRAVATGDQRGIALDVDEPLTIEVASSGGGGWVRLRLSDAQRIEVRSPSATTVFVSERTRLSVEHPSRDTLDISVPRAATSVELVIEDRVRWTAERGSVQAEAGDVWGAGWLVALPERGR